MFKKKILISIFFLIFSFALYFILLFDSSPEFQSSKLIEVEKISSLRVNNYDLSEEYYPYLKSLLNLKPVSYNINHYHSFHLEESEADEIVVEYPDRTSLKIYTGKKATGREGVYIRIDGDETIYLCDGQLLYIIDEKPDILREYPLFGKMQLLSIIALNIETEETSIFATVDSGQLWIDQISGNELSRLKVQNFINHLLNLRVVRSNDDSETNDFSQRLTLETSTGERETIYIREKENSYILKNNENLYSVEKEKFDFTQVVIENLK